MAVPFAMSHEAVTPITVTSHYPDGGWIGYLKGTAWSQWIDEYLMLTLGGIPWQVRFCIALIEPQQSP